MKSVGLGCGFRGQTRDLVLTRGRMHCAHCRIGPESVLLSKFALLWTDDRDRSVLGAAAPPGASAAGGSRTHTPSRTSPFEGLASTVPPPPHASVQSRPSHPSQIPIGAGGGSVGDPGSPIGPARGGVVRGAGSGRVRRGL